MKLFPKVKEAQLKKTKKVKKILGHSPEKILKFFVFAEAAASLSKIPTGGVGAVALDRYLNVLSTGWNGFPRGVNDNAKNRLIKGEKRYWTCHAEGNVVAQAARTGAKLNKSILLVTSLFPCSNCAALSIQAGVKHIFAKRSPEGTRWFEQDKYSVAMFKEAGIKIHYVKQALNNEGKSVLVLDT